MNFLAKPFTMRCVLYFLLFSLLCSCDTKKESMTVPQSTSFYVGTYTDGDSEGIYQYELLADGSMKQIGLAAKMTNPSYLAFSKDRKYLLAVGEVDEGGHGFVHSFKVTKDSLTSINKSKSGGAHPCFVSVNGKGQVAVANYTGGNVGFLQLNDAGALSDLLIVEQHEGNGTHSRQEAPHAHSVYFTGENAVVSADLGTNDLWFSTMELEGETKKICTENFSMNAEAGPRHLTFHSDGNTIYYVLNELDNTVSVLRKNKSGKYELGSSISTLPVGHKEYNTSADIHLSADGKFLYTSNRGHNSIAIFSVSENGNLTFVAHESTRGNTPRNFSLSPDDEYVVVANQDSNNIVSFKRSSETGLLEFVAEVGAPKPVCILF